MRTWNKGRELTPFTLLGKIEWIAVGTRASFIQIKALEFSTCFFSSCDSAATSRALYTCPSTWICQAIARLLHLILPPYCEVSLSTL